MSPSSLAFSRPIDAHKVAALIEILIEADTPHRIACRPCRLLAFAAADTDLGSDLLGRVQRFGGRQQAREGVSSLAS